MFTMIRIVFIASISIFLIEYHNAKRIARGNSCAYPQGKSRYTSGVPKQYSNVLLLLPQLGVEVVVDYMYLTRLNKLYDINETKFLLKEQQQPLQPLVLQGQRVRLVGVVVFLEH